MVKTAGRGEVAFAPLTCPYSPLPPRGRGRSEPGVLGEQSTPWPSTPRKEAESWLQGTIGAVSLLRACCPITSHEPLPIASLGLPSGAGPTGTHPAPLDCPSALLRHPGRRVPTDPLRGGGSRATWAWRGLQDPNLWPPSCPFPGPSHWRLNRGPFLQLFLIHTPPRHRLCPEDARSCCPVCLCSDPWSCVPVPSGPGPRWAVGTELDVKRAGWHAGVGWSRTPSPRQAHGWRGSDGDG